MAFKPMNSSLLRQMEMEMGISKRAFVPAPQSNQEGPPPSDPNSADSGMPPQGGPVDPNQLLEMAMQGLKQGVSPQEVASTFQQNGVSPDMIDKVMNEAMSRMQSKGGSPEEAPSEEAPPKLNIKELTEQAIEKEKVKQLAPEDRILRLEKQVEVLTEIVQNLVDTMPPKQASDKTFLEALTSNLQVGEETYE